MTNVSLKISTRECIPDNQFLGYEGENEVNKLIFKFEDGFFDGSALLNVHKGEQKGFVTLDKVDETYELEVKNSLLSQKGDVTFQLVITSTEGKVIKFNPFVMTVKDAIDTDVEMPEEYPSWIDEANMKLAEITKAIENAEQVTTEIIEAKENGEFDGKDGFSPSAKVEPTEKGALITITDENGTTTAEVLHGQGGSGEGGTTNYNALTNKPKINNIELSGNKTLDQLGIQPKGNYANKDEIPTKTSELTNDSNFATENYVDEEIAKFDFIKVVDSLPETGLPNRLYFVPKSDTQTQDLFDEYVWVNGKWEWITTKQIEVDLTEYVKYTDYATQTKAGVIKLGSSATGLQYDTSGYLKIMRATEADIDGKMDYYKPIVPNNLTYAVESVVGKHVTLTQAEYDALETKDENTYYYIVEEG